MLLFGTAGIPNACKGKILDALICLKNLGLDAMELEFVYGVRLSLESARKIRNRARALGLSLTAHAPYYINLLSSEKAEASKERLLKAALVAKEAGCKSLVFHAGYYGKLSKKEAFERVKQALAEISELAKGIWIRPETTGKQSQWGSLEEVIEISKEFDNVLPCIDFAHLLARSFGRINGYEAFSSVLRKIEKELGEEGIKNMHVHISGIVYSTYGEKKHVNLEESEIKWQDLLRALHDFNAGGIVICESPNLEQDALLLKKFWKELFKG